MAEALPPPPAAFITGGSSGIGLALATLLAEAGHDLALIARDLPRLEAARRALLDRFPARRVAIFSADVGDRDACREAAAAALETFGPPAIAIANAGVAKPGRFLDQEIEDHEMHMATNYFGALHFAHALAPAMARNGGGRLVFVSSGAAFFGIYGYSAYAPSKFALRGLAEVLRVELAPHGIGVTVAYPPDTDTPQLATEALTKPPATKAITAGGGLFSAERVAAAILAGVRRNRFVVAPGFQMAFLNASHSLLAPALRFYQAALVRRHQ